MDRMSGLRRPLPEDRSISVTVDLVRRVAQGSLQSHTVLAAGSF